jgi:hypothetical protein
LKKEPKLSPSDFQEEVERLKTEQKMPTLEELLEAIGEVRKEYRPKILAARKNTWMPKAHARASSVNKGTMRRSDGCSKFSE